MTETSARTDTHNLLETQVTELYRTSNLANLAIFAIAILLAWILSPVADSEALTIWLSYQLVITLARAAITFQYRNPKFPAQSPKVWLNLYSAGVFLSGLGWGSVIVFVVPVDATFHLVSAIFVVGGLVTAAAGTMASLKHGFAIYSIPALLPGALKLIVLNETNTVLIGLFICAFLIFIAMIAMRMHEVILHSLKKQFESARFVVEVQEIHEALIARYDDLENQLKLSTQKVQELQAALGEKDGTPVAVTDQAEGKARSDRFSYLLDKLHGGAWNYNLKTGDLRFSPQWLNMLGYKEDEVYSTMDFWKSLLHPDERSEVLEKLQLHISGKIPQYFSSHRLKTRAGDWIWVFSRGQPVVWGTFGEVLDIVCVDIDIEDPETHLASKLSSANFKASDWLYSETMFMQRLQYALQTTALENIEHALCQISVYPVDMPADRPPPGAELSKQLANILMKECRHEDPVLARGNNSFVVLLENLSIDKAMNKAASLQKTLDSHQFGGNGQKYHVQSFIGITPLAVTRRTVSEILEDAETACNIASNDAPDNIFVFQRDSAEFDSGTLEKRIIAKIRDILAHKRLQLTTTMLKPLAHPGTTRMSWLTAALPGPKNYALAVKELRDPQERDGLAQAFDLCAIEMFHDWAVAQPKQAELQNVYVFECKPNSISDDAFMARVTQLYAHDRPGSHVLCLGIPEAAFTAHDDKVRAFISALKPAGVKFALTDFGAASFSFDYMKKLPVDYVKLHDSLVANIDIDKSSLLTLRYLNEIGRVLNFKSIAFCSDIDQETALGKIGTDFVRSAAADSQALGASAAPAAAKPVAAYRYDVNLSPSIPE